MTGSRNSASLFTIGYEGRDVNELLTRLKAARVTTLIDVRYRPQSRKRGFSRNQLSAFCASAGINYVHCRELGTPPEMMRKFGVGGYDAAAFHEYRQFLLRQDDALHDAGNLVKENRCCLMCYEKDAQTCHRRVVAEELERTTGVTVTHL